MSWTSFFRQSVKRLFATYSPRAPRGRTRSSCRPYVEQLETRELLSATMDIGMNLERVSDNSVAWVFKDAFQSSRPWTSYGYNTATGALTLGGGGPVTVDPQGWPTTLNQITNSLGQLVQQRLTTQMFDGIAGNYASGVYRAEWDGSGTLVWGGDATVIEQGNSAGRYYALLNVVAGSNGITLSLNAMSSTDPVRNIDVWMPDYNGQSFAGQQWTPGAAFSPFHPLFVERLEPFDTIRFMDMQLTNSSDIVTWADRRAVDAATQMSNRSGFQSGIAPEYMVELANEVQANAWFNMPYLADDDFVRNFATLVRDSLDPGLKVYVEWSNEVYNYAPGFETYPWVTEQLASPENAGVDRWTFVANQIRQDFAIWTDVFAGATDRLVRVVAGWEADSTVVDQILQQMDGDFDAISPSAYVQLSNAQRATLSAKIGRAHV